MISKPHKIYPAQYRKIAAFDLHNPNYDGNKNRKKSTADFDWILELVTCLLPNAR